MGSNVANIAVEAISGIIGRHRRGFWLAPGSPLDPSSAPLTGPAQRSHGWVAMPVETRFLRLTKPVALGDRIDGWRVW